MNIKLILHDCSVVCAIKIFTVFFTINYDKM